MATSGSSNWTMSRDAIVSAALRKLGVIADGAVATATQITNGAEALNNIVFSLYAQGMPLWAMKEQTWPLVAGTNTYTWSLTGTWDTEAPLKVVQGWITDTTNSNTDIPLNKYTSTNYNLLSEKTDPGRPIHFWYEPGINTGTMRLWPTPDADSVTNCTVTFRYQSNFEQFNSSTDTPDFPQVWYEALIYSLAHRLSPEYGVGLQERSMLQSEANTLIDNALSFGTEEGSLFLQPDWVMYDMGH